MATEDSSTSSMAQGHDISSTFGVIEIAILMVMFLTGISTLQAWNYFRDYPQDTRFMKLAVGFVYLMDVLHTAFLAQGLHHYTIRNFGNFTELDKIIWTLIATAPLAGIVSFVVRTYFCLRIKVITYTPYYALGCWILSLSLLVFDSLVAASVATSGTFSKIHTPRSQTLGLATLCIGAASDLLIAGFLCMGLLRARDASGFASTNRILDKLIAYTISSGLITSIMAVVEAIVFGLFENYAFLAFYCLIPKLFSNSFLASLNERSYLRREEARLHNNSGSRAFRSAQSVSQDHRVTFERSAIVTGRSEFELEAVTHTQFEAGLDDKERGLVNE